MGIYGVLFVALIAFSVFLVVSIFFGVERGAKSAHAVSSAVGTIIILAAVFIYFGMWFFGLGCALFDWCPLRNHLAN